MPNRSIVQPTRFNDLPPVYSPACVGTVRSRVLRMVVPRFRGVAGLVETGEGWGEQGSFHLADDKPSESYKATRSVESRTVEPSQPPNPAEAVYYLGSMAPTSNPGCLDPWIPGAGSTTLVWAEWARWVWWGSLRRAPTRRVVAKPASYPKWITTW